MPNASYAMPMTQYEIVASKAGTGTTRCAESFDFAQDRLRSPRFRVVAASSMAPNKANFRRFWPGNKGCVEKQSQSVRPRLPISDCGFEEAGGARVPSVWRQTKPISRFLGLKMRFKLKDKAKSPQPGVGGGGFLLYSSAAGGYTLGFHVCQCVS